MEAVIIWDMKRSRSKCKFKIKENEKLTCEVLIGFARSRFGKTFNFYFQPEIVPKSFRSDVSVATSVDIIRLSELLSPSMSRNRISTRLKVQSVIADNMRTDVECAQLYAKSPHAAKLEPTVLL